jgi:hypothetical protein
MLSCKEVAHLASDYLDKNAGATLSWKIRLHLVACKCCRRFIKHLEITKTVVPQFVHGYEQPDVDAEAVLKRIKESN